MASGRNFLLRGRTDRIVRAGPEATRIFNLPRRIPFASEMVVGSANHSALWTPVLKTPTGSQVLRPEQAWALSEIAAMDGGIVNLAVGAGKSIVSYLAGAVLGAERPLVLLPASTLEEKTIKIDLPEARQHWRVPDRLMFVSYERMARAGQHDFFWRLMPDVVIADEAHRLRNTGTAVWRRLERYFEGNPKTRFVGLSGTLTVSSLRDYAHLFWLALREGSPVPHRFNELEDWADALDEDVSDEYRPAPGVLLELCVPSDWAPEELAVKTPVQAVRKAFRRRMQETRGYVFTETASCAASLVIRERVVPVPQNVVDALREMRRTFQTPTGDEIGSPLEFRNHLDEVMLGMCYRWIWPNNRPDRPWLRARRAWKSFVRFVIGSSGQGYATHDMFGRVAINGLEFDTEMQVALACLHGRLRPPVYPVAPEPDRPREDLFLEWRHHRDRLAATLSELHHRRLREPPREAVWLDRFMVLAAKAWLTENEQALLWVNSVEFLEALREEGVPCYGGGQHEVVRETRSCALSLQAHGEGKNLQAFNKNWFMTPLENSKQAEQALGRTHRSGQKADEVLGFMSLPCWEWWNAFDNARRETAYVEETMQSQLLNRADILVPTAEEIVRRATAEPPDPLWRTEWKVEEVNANGTNKVNEAEAK